MKVEVTSLAGELPAGFTIQVKAAAELFLKKEQLPGGEIIIVICSDSYIARLNRKYRRRKGPTDVLSFYMVEPKHLYYYRGRREEVYLGEIYISLDRAREQAWERGASLLQELRNLTAHGLYHLVGFDHRNSRERLRMKIKEKTLLREAQRNTITGGSSHENTFQEF